MWFLDYVYILLDLLIRKPNASLGSICSEAYNLALAPHHPFAVRFAAKTGMLIVGRYCFHYYLVEILSLKLFFKIMKIFIQLWRFVEIIFIKLKLDYGTYINKNN